MFRFAHPDLLWLLVVVALVALLMVIMRRVRARRLARFGNAELVREMMPDVARWREGVKDALLLLALSLLVIAAARPQFGTRLREERQKGVEMMLVVDVSNSMLAEDLSPNRLDRTRYAIDKLFGSLQQGRVGMVVFAGEAKVQLPITGDYRMARSFARRLSTDLVSVQGTAIGRALQLATLSFSQREQTGRAMILITDGETHDEGAVEAAQHAAEQGIHTFVIAIGTPEGAPVKVGGQMLRNAEGDMVVSKLNEPLLMAVAEAGNGGYVRATNADFGLDSIVESINSMEQSEMETLQFEEYDEQYIWPLSAALVLLVLELLVLASRNPALRRFNIFSR